MILDTQFVQIFNMQGVVIFVSPTLHKMFPLTVGGFQGNTYIEAFHVDPVTQHILFGADSNDTAIVNFPNQKIFFYLEKDETAYKWKTMSSEANMGSINSIQIRYDQL